MRRFTVLKTGEYIRSSFARKMYQVGSVQVSECIDYSVGPRYSQPNTLLCRIDTTVVVPIAPQDARRVAAHMVRDYPALSIQVQ